jgi:hypothetical protein
MHGHYSVSIEPFAERHFIKSFAKKYKNHWEVTLRAIIAELERIDMLLHTSRAEVIIDGGAVKIIKTQFRVDRSKESAKTSGNRCIVGWHQQKQYVSVLLVYSKTDLSGTNETAEWQRLVKENYVEWRELFV